MAGRASVVVLVLALGGCANEVVTVRESSIASQFAQLNKNGWKVSQPGDQPASSGKPDQNVRVIREANFDGLMFRTNFQVDDPRFPSQSPQSPASNRPDPAGSAPPAPPAFPFGAPLPGR